MEGEKHSLLSTSNMCEIKLFWGPMFPMSGEKTHCVEGQYEQVSEA